MKSIMVYFVVIKMVDPTYEELQEHGELLSEGSSLHLWDEEYEYNGKQYRVMGTFSDPDYIEINEIDDFL